MSVLAGSGIKNTTISIINDQVSSTEKDITASHGVTWTSAAAAEARGHLTGAGWLAS